MELWEEKKKGTMSWDITKGLEKAQIFVSQDKVFALLALLTAFIYKYACTFCFSISCFFTNSGGMNDLSFALVRYGMSGYNYY